MCLRTSPLPVLVIPTRPGRSGAARFWWLPGSGLAALINTGSLAPPAPVSCCTTVRVQPPTRSERVSCKCQSVLDIHHRGVYYFDMASRLQLLLCLCVVSALCLSSCRAAPTRDPVQSACRCTREINMVCANDGKTYSNKCMLNCAKAMGTSRMGSALKIVKMGEC